MSLKQRIGQLTAKQANTVCRTFDAFINEGGIHLLEVSRQAFQSSTDLIRSMQGLRAGDALHLAVMLELSIKYFATLDK